MQIFLYNTTDGKNVVNKKLTDETEMNIKFKDKTDIKNPLVIIHSENPISFNYAYIPNFKRYYFIDSIEVFPNSIYNVSLTCDVLESFKTDILESSGFISRQEMNVNNYYNSDYETEVRKEVDLYESSITHDTTIKTNILVSVGGV